ncbi:hypothetical protein N7537_007086 [Penicillium hordei]|uniref:Uncharacterized protein n=1 Tax=Penicillium hordei TaxID=40994 RepID=A0AAD6E9H4_9EURO|nr:uncharacterized protein N7537_007086 [Penicillium hordei]KAJ5604130.1 hypothetical protein N7537_007086 [Penicillium hordei]
MYGAPPRDQGFDVTIRVTGFAPIISRTIQEIENIDREIPEDREQEPPFPIRLRNEVDNLERQLVHSLPNTSLPVHHLHGIDIETVVDNLSIARHIGAHIFYERGINKECDPRAVVGMDEISVCLDRVEDIKI